MRRHFVVSLIALGFLAAIASSAAAQSAVEKGAAVFAAQKCSMCHSLDGKGMAKGPLDGVGKKFTAEEIHDWIVKPAEMTAKGKGTHFLQKTKEAMPEDAPGLGAAIPRTPPPTAAAKPVEPIEDDEEPEDEDNGGDEEEPEDEDE